MLAFLPEAINRCFPERVIIAGNMVLRLYQSLRLFFLSFSKRREAEGNSAKPFPSDG
jgi:hypothetical protein